MMRAGASSASGAHTAAAHANGGEASSSSAAAAPATSSTIPHAGEGAATQDGTAVDAVQEDVSYQSMDSEELSALEEMAEAESESDTEIDRLLDEAADAFSPETVAQMTKDLKQHGIVTFLQRYVAPDPQPRRIKHLLLALGVFLPRSMREADTPLEVLLPILKTALARILRRREKLPEYNTVDDALELLQRSKRIMVLSGAGISVSCGIPDFRSKDGIYSQLQSEGKYELDDPQDMFDKGYFLHNPAMFYSFAHRIFPSNFVPSSAHRFIKLLEDRDQLLRNYSQNIDTLEQLAGIERVLQCHGSFATASCTDPTCGYKCNGRQIAKDIFAQTVPACPACEERKARQAAKKPSKKKRKLGNGGSWRPTDDDDDDDDAEDETALAGFGILKPNITFFGEKLSDDFDRALLADREHVDLLVVMGTSLKVAPVSDVLGHIPHTTPVILINKTPILHMATDIMLLGDCDHIVEYLCRRLGWPLPKIQPDEEVVGTPAAQQARERVEQHDEEDSRPASGVKESSDAELKHPERLMNSHAWLFEGAEPGRLPALLAEVQADVESDEDDVDVTEHPADGDEAPSPTSTSPPA
ncbi:TRAPP 20 K subunit [Moesziomyces antarcticus T-34]|uniref:TRAPP 20 K subunit n=1 Tax=Pseudozyma antarctica (strain T-34) TaxID=1151754 RepID=M9LUE5_PSEA3|nr:TRAPP 20 K subunit [Moesziomyces antarcticus T-34]